MKRIMVILICLQICALGRSQSPHIIQRGETIELIAQRYNMSVSDLVSANPDIVGYYSGIKLNIPEGRTMSETITTVTPVDNSMLDAASDYLNAGKYRKAASIYSDVLKNTQTAYAYYGRGISYYNREKYKSAMKDLQAAQNCPDCTDEIREHCTSLIKQAETLRAEQHERRNQIWGGITLAFAQTAATVYMASEQQKAQQAYNRTPSYSGHSGSSSSLSKFNAITAQSNAYVNQMRANQNAQLNMMTQQTLIQAQQGYERLQESGREEIKWRGEFLEKYGREPTVFEADQWYYSHYPDLFESRIQARANSMERESTRSEQQNDNQGNKSSTSSGSNQRVETKSSDCRMCYGLGSCRTCDGRGYYYNPLDLSKKVLCPNCRNHDGRCTSCNGTGKKK